MVDWDLLTVFLLRMHRSSRGRRRAKHRESQHEHEAEHEPDEEDLHSVHSSVSEASMTVAKDSLTHFRAPLNMFL